MSTQRIATIISANIVTLLKSRGWDDQRLADEIGIDPDVLRIELETPGIWRSIFSPKSLMSSRYGRRG